MADEPDKLILAHPRHMRGTLERVADDVAGLKARVGDLERSLAQVQVTLAKRSVRFAEHLIGMDRIESR